MSDKKDKPADYDPDATVSVPPSKVADFDPDATVTAPRKAADHDPDATVAIPPRKAAKDDDATVMMPSRAALEEPADDDVTVTNMTREALFAQDAKDAAKVDDDATVSIPPGGLRAEAAAETAAAIGSPTATPEAFKAGTAGASDTPPPASVITAEPSRIPMIAGGLVVLLVVLYFLFSGGEKPAPVATAPTPPSPPLSSPASSAPSTASSAPPAAAAPAPSAPSAPAPAPSAAAPATPSAAPAASASAGPAGTSKIADLLAADIKRGTVAVAEEGGGTTITIPLSQQFASGATDPDPKLRTVLLAIASALDKTPGAIVVTGHADATPSNNAKFPSNQELSAARGATAAKLMAGKLRDPKRISSDGASDSKPLAPSDTAENRAKNRRVVIVLKPA
jgi:flagellar motor protein MotB